MVFLIYGTPSLAERLIGTICDENNKPVSGANVSISTPNDGKIVTDTQTTSKGVFTINALKPENISYHVRM